MDIQDRRDQLKQWLQENVTPYVVTENITLFAFNVDWNTFTSTFSAKFDEQVCPKQFRFAAEVYSHVAACFRIVSSCP